MLGATFARPDLTTFCRLDEFGLEATGQRLEPAAGARAAGLATDDAAGHGPPLPVHRLRARVALGHKPGRRTMGDATEPARSRASNLRR